MRKAPQPTVPLPVRSQPTFIKRDVRGRFVFRGRCLCVYSKLSPTVNLLRTLKARANGDPVST